MATIRILPLDVELESGDDATIMGTAQALGYYWPTTCNGEARCTTCAPGAIPRPNSPTGPAPRKPG